MVGPLQWVGKRSDTSRRIFMSRKRPESRGQSPTRSSRREQDWISLSGDPFDPDEVDGETLDHLSGQVSPPEIRCAKSYGRYRVIREIGSGGFSAVFLGHDDQLDRRVAIKVSNLEDDGKAQRRAMEEARSLAKLRHSGIVTVYDVGKQGGQCYIVADFLEGPSLSDWLKKYQPSWQQAAALVASVADALAYAHARRTVHRDVKPQNIILVDGVYPVLVDFGLALVEFDMSQAWLGAIEGTPSYMSPEQAIGRATRIDGRTDIYSLGVVLYRLLCGQRPFRASRPKELLRQIREDEPQPPRQLNPQLPVELERICLKAMAKQVADRYTTATDLADELHAALQSADTQTPLASSVPSIQPREINGGVATDIGATRRAEPTSERRRLTLMVCQCDLLLSEDNLDSLDPESQHEIAKVFASSCQEAIQQFDGTFVQSSGQENLICFGFPVAHEDDPQRAIRAAIQIMDCIPQINLELTDRDLPTIRASCVIHTGEVVATKNPSGHSGEPVSLVGEARNVVAQLERYAQPDAIIVSDTTQKLVRGFFEFDLIGSQRVHGAKKPLKLFELLREASVRGRIEAEASEGLTPLVGRDIEFGILKDRWEKTTEGMAQFVTLIGEPGLGKSRLVYEIRQHVLHQEADDRPPAVVEFLCSPYHQSSGLHPATDFLGRLLEFRQTTHTQQRLDRLVKHLTELDFTDPEEISVFAALLSLDVQAQLPLPTYSPQRLMQRTQELVIEWLCEFAQRQPVLFIVEDLHWVDPSTLEMLGRLVEQGFHQNLMTVFTFRPDFAAPWTSCGHQTQLALNRLSQAQVAEMVCAQTGVASLPEFLEARLFERTDGIPLFVEEYGRMMLESNLETNGSSMIEDARVLDTIPDSLQDLLVARLDRMDCNYKVVQLAATIGREFSHELLAAVCDIDDAALQFELDKLVQAGLLFSKGRSPRRAYIFKHALIQDAAYDSLLIKQRQKYHRMVATELESRFPDLVESEPEILAHHYTRSDDVEYAITYWLKAGVRSQERSANAEALSHLTAGMKLVESLDPSPRRDNIELQFRLPLSAVCTASFGYASPEVSKHNRRARELCQRIGSEAPLFDVMMLNWAYEFIQGQITRGTQTSLELIALANAANDDGLLTEANWACACTSWWAGRFAEAGDHAARACELYSIDASSLRAKFTQQNCGPIVKCHWGHALLVMGYPDQAAEKYEEAIELAHQLDHPFSMATAVWQPGWGYENARSGQQAMLWAERTIEASAQPGFLFWEALGLMQKGSALTLLGDYEESIPLIRRGAEKMRSTGCSKVLQHYWAQLADALWYTGHRGEAWTTLEQAQAISSADSERFAESDLHRRRGDFLFDESRFAEAENQYLAAIDIAQSQQARLFELRATTRLATLLLEQNRRDEGLSRLQRIYDWFSEGFDWPDLVAARTLLNS